MTIDRTMLYDFIRVRPLAVLATVSADRAPESALINIAVSEELELVFDTIETSRKHANLARDPHIAFVIGWDGEETVQYEGIADGEQNAELERLKAIYFAAFPEGEARRDMPGIVYYRVRPTWIRFSSYYRPRRIEEMRFA